MAKSKWKTLNWEKIGVYIAAISLLILFGGKINELGERISRIEGMIEERNRK